MGSDESTPEIHITEVPAEHRFEIFDGGEKAGFAAYVDAGAQRIFHHTVVEDRFRGRGLAGRLVGEALTRSTQQGRRIVPVCSYVARYVQRHGEYDGFLDPVTSETHQALAASGEG